LGALVSTRASKSWIPTALRRPRLMMPCKRTRMRAPPTSVRLLCYVGRSGCAPLGDDRESQDTRGCGGGAVRTRLHRRRCGTDGGSLAAMSRAKRHNSLARLPSEYLGMTQAADGFTGGAQCAFWRTLRYQGVAPFV
jgi:hypothetical protein